MTRLTRIFCFCSFVLVVGVGQCMLAQDSPSQTPDLNEAPASKQLSVEEIGALLDSIDPYLPGETVSGEIDMFGSTSMDLLAHKWANGFKNFHPEVEVVISAEGSETVFGRLAKNPSSIGMVSRPVTTEDLESLKAAGLKRPVAIQVAREPLGVFVNAGNPLEVITYPQLVTLFCSQDETTEITWDAVGVAGEVAAKTVHIISRDEKSGTRKFTEKYLFHLNKMRKAERELGSNAQVVSAVGTDVQAIAVADFKFSNASVRRLKLKDKTSVIEGDEHEILLGRYPITRPLTLVFDLEGQGEQATANREFVKHALAKSGQSSTILAGFFPYDPATLRGELSKLELGETDQP